MQVPTTTQAGGPRQRRTSVAVYAADMSGLQKAEMWAIGTTCAAVGGIAVEVFKKWQTQQQAVQRSVSELQGELRSVQQHAAALEDKLGAAQEAIGKLKQQLLSEEERTHEQMRRAEEAEAAVAALKAAQSPKTGN